MSKRVGETRLPQNVVTGCYSDGGTMMCRIGALIWRVWNQEKLVVERFDAGCFLCRFVCFAVISLLSLIRYHIISNAKLGQNLFNNSLFLISKNLTESCYGATWNGLHNDKYVWKNVYRWKNDWLRNIADLGKSNDIRFRFSHSFALLANHSKSRLHW